MRHRLFIESRIFTKHIGDYLDDDEYSALQRHLLARPAAGPIIRGSGGVRKLRWSVPGKGKSGGVRVIYYIPDGSSFWMLTIYSKGEVETIPGPLLKKIKERWKMAKRDIGQEILDSINEIKAGNVGRVQLYITPAQIKAVRQKVGVSQSAFAAMLNVSPRTLQEWEQGRRQPNGPARSLLAIAAKRPEVMQEVFAA